MPLKWRAERIEEFLAATHGRDVTARPNSRWTPTEKRWPARRSLANLGACGTAGIVIQLLIGPWVSTSIYDIGTIDLRIERC